MEIRELNSMFAELDIPPGDLYQLIRYAESLNRQERQLVTRSSDGGHEIRRKMYVKNNMTRLYKALLQAEKQFKPIQNENE